MVANMEDIYFEIDMRTIKYSTIYFNPTLVPLQNRRLHATYHKVTVMDRLALNLISLN